MKSKEDLVLQIQNKRVLFISTRNIDYIRCFQEIEIIKKYSKSYTILGYIGRDYFSRIIGDLRSTVV